MSHSAPSASTTSFRGGARGCRLCGQPLSTLARQRGDVCEAMDCRRRATEAVTRERRAADLDLMRAIAAQAWDEPVLTRAPTLWLKQHDDDFVAPPASAIADLRERLLSLEADEPDHPPMHYDEDEVRREATSPAITGQLCALCRGRCCRLGLQGWAFLEPHHLRGWLDQTPGARWPDAVDHYLGFVPSTHLEGSCVFHGERGCSLPRERRSDVCNQYACEPLEQLRDIAAADPQAIAVVGIVASHRTDVGAVVSAQGRRWLPDPRESD